MKHSNSLLTLAAFVCNDWRRRNQAALWLFSVALLLMGGAATVSGQTVVDGFDPNANNTVRVVVVQPDGKILIGGDFTTVSPNGGAAVARNYIARLNADGTLDTAFNPNGSGGLLYHGVFAIALQTDGKILVGGDFTGMGGQTRNHIARLDPTTGLADAWNPNATNTQDYVYAIAVQADGKILAGGNFSAVNSSIGGQPRNFIARLDPVTGFADSWNPNASLTVYTIVVQADAKILVGGTFTGIGGQTRNHIARLDATTGLADAFNPNVSDYVNSIAVQADGKILAGGQFTSIGGQPRNRIARLDATTGLPDSFDPNANLSVNSIAVQTDGKILAGGAFTSIGGQPRNHIARLDATTGSADSFDPNANGQILSIAVQADGKVLVGGQFTTLAPDGGGAVTRNRIARLGSGTAPAFTSANNTTFTVGSNGSFTVTATGNPTPTLSESGALPSGVTFTPATGVLSGTPAAGTAGTYPITFTASNSPLSGLGSGLVVMQSFTLTVNQSPAITSANNTTFAEGSNGIFTVTATGSPTPTLSESGALPSGVTFTPATGVLSGTPAVGTGGTYPITFTASNGVGSAAMQSFTLTVTYLPSGALQVNLAPAGAVSAGAQWQVDGGTFQNSGSVVTNLAVGNHTVSFNTIPNWISPSNETVVVAFAATNTDTANYVPIVGALQVTISPAEAVSAGAQWQVDGGSFLNSGIVVSNLPVGNHTIAFRSVAGWFTPSSQTVLVLSDATNSVTTTYLPNIGALQVTLKPLCAALAGAQFQVDSGPFQNSGSLVTNLNGGSHTLSFSSVPGWGTLTNLKVTVTANTTNQVVATYPHIAVAGNITWVSGGANQNWSNTNNWDLNRVPTNSDTVFIPYVTGTNCILDVSATVAGLHIGDCPEGGSDGLNFNGQTLTVTGPIIIQSSASLTLNQNSTLIGTNAVINGVLGWTSGTLVGTFTVASNSVVNITSASNNHRLGNCLVTNYGTVNWRDDILYAGGSSPATVIYNYGLWNAQDDRTMNTTFFGGSIVVDNFGTFRKSGGINSSQTSFSSDVTFNNTGTVDVQQGNFTLSGGGNFSGGLITTNGTGTTILASGSYNFNGTTTGTNLVQHGGGLVGMNVIKGGLTWLSGSWIGAVTVASNSVVNIALASNAHYLGNCLVTNYGTVNWRDDILYAGGSSPATVIYNYGLWNAQDDRTMNTTFFGGNIVFDNFGTFRKSGGISSSQTAFSSDVTLNNTGTVDVEVGNFMLYGIGNFTGGSITTTGTGTTILASGSYHLNGTITGTNLVQNGGNLTGTNIIHGGLTWFSGSWSGTVLTVSSNSVVNIAAASNSHYFPNCIITNLGTVNWRDDILYGGGIPGTLIYNYGIWTAQDDRMLQSYYGGNGIDFENYGTFRKSAGNNTGQTSIYIGVTFNNTGTLDIQTGNVNLQGAYSLTNGTLSFGLNNLTNFGRLSLAGSAALGGPLRVNVAGNFAPAIGNQFQIVSASGVSGTFGGVNVPAGISVAYSNNGVYLLVVGSVPVQLLAPQLVGTNLVFQFATASGQSYTVQRNDDLATTNWVYYTNLVGNGAVFQFQTPVTVTPAKRFFRIREP